VKVRFVDLGHILLLPGPGAHVTYNANDFTPIRTVRGTGVQPYTLPSVPRWEVALDRKPGWRGPPGAPGRCPWGGGCDREAAVCAECEDSPG